MPLPSPETLDFLGQLLDTSSVRERDRAMSTHEELLGTYRPSATDIALCYWMAAIDHDRTAPTPLRVDLHGADLSGLLIHGPSPEHLLNLADANLSETQLIAIRFEHVDLAGDDLTRAQAERAESHYVQARDITVTEADPTGAIWRHCDAFGLRGGASADWHECPWVACDLDPAALPEDFGQRGTLSADSSSLCYLSPAHTLLPRDRHPLPQAAEAPVHPVDAPERVCYVRDIRHHTCRRMTKEMIWFVHERRRRSGCGA
jgi:uncharacterized protein YjbI with pentapeptide repeats